VKKENLIILKLGEKMNLTKEVMKRTLYLLHEDGVIECNQYQGEEFDRLYRRVMRK
jgi:transcription initiation factor IIE alpha subunit